MDKTHEAESIYDPERLSKYERWYLRIVVVGTIFTIAAVIVAYFALHESIVNANNATNQTNYLIQHYIEEQRFTERQSIAQAVILDIYDTSQTLNNSLIYYNKTNIISGYHNTFWYPYPFYNDNRLYYTNLLDIYKLDENSTVDVFLYYTGIIQLEQERQYIVTRRTTPYGYNNSIGYENYTIRIYTAWLPGQIKYSMEQGNQIEKELEEKYEINANLSKLNREQVYYNGVNQF